MDTGTVGTETQRDRETISPTDWACHRTGRGKPAQGTERIQTSVLGDLRPVHAVTSKNRRVDVAEIPRLVEGMRRDPREAFDRFLGMA